MNKVYDYCYDYSGYDQSPDNIVLDRIALYTVPPRDDESSSCLLSLSANAVDNC